MNIIPIQVTDEGVLIPKTYFHNLDDIEIVKSAEYILVKTKKSIPLLTQSSPDARRFWASFGAWQEDRSVEATLNDIYQSRRSKVDPPSL